MSGWCGPIENQALGWDATRRHGMYNTPTYRVWAGMTQRCLNPKNDRWNDYGGRGITVCEQWKIFDNFLADMGVRPSGKSLDRYPDPNGNYEPGNCRWATAKEQHNNMRSNHSLTLNGRTQNISQWAEETGVGASTIFTRLNRGWTAEKALKVPKPNDLRTSNKSGFPGVYKQGSGWASQVTVKGKTINTKREIPLLIQKIQIEAKLCTCQICSYQWISTRVDTDPSHCQNRECRSREWNGKKERKAQESKPAVILPKPNRIRGGNDDDLL